MVEYEPTEAAGEVFRNWLSLSSMASICEVLRDQSSAHATEGAMPKQIEIAMAVLFTACRLLNFNCLVEQTPFRNHNDVAGAEPDVTFEVGAGFICLVVEHEDRFVAARAASSNLDTLLCRERANAAS